MNPEQANPTNPDVPKPVKVVLRKALLVGKVNHDRGDVVEVDKFKAKKLVDDHAAYKLDADGDIVPELDHNGEPLPIENLDPTPAPAPAPSKEAEVS